MCKLNLHSIKDLLAQNYQSNWLVDDFFELESVAMLFGEPGTFKSFLAMELAFCVGSGLDWYDKPVMKGDVVYLAGEGFYGIQKRIRALELKYKQSAQNLFVSSKPAELTSKKSVTELLQIIKECSVDPALIIIDTLHRNFGSGDESSARDFGIVMNHLDLIKRETKATILFIHHPGHAGKGHSRGSSSIRASLDTEYQMKKLGDDVELICMKMKEFEQPDKLCFRIVPKDVKTTSGLVSSAFLEVLDPNTQASNKSKREQQVFDTLLELTNSQAISIPPSIRKKLTNSNARFCMETEKWRTAVYEKLKQDQKKHSTRQATFRRCMKSLIASGKVVEYQGYSIII